MNNLNFEDGDTLENSWRIFEEFWKNLFVVRGRKNFRFAFSLCLLEVPNNQQKSLILASKRPRRSGLTSDLEFVAQIAYATMFVLAA